MAAVQVIPAQERAPFQDARWLWGVVGALVVSAVVLITYQPSLDISFFAEDYKLMDWPARLNLWQYFVIFFDPTVPAGWYRPVQGIQFGLEYALFGTPAPPYHVFQVLVHLGNCLLLYGLIRYVVRDWKPAIIAPVFYAGLPAVNPAVFWVSVTDPLASFFYLLALALWLRYLQVKRVFYYSLVLVVFVTALLSKEIGITLPILFFLAERWLIRDSATVRQLFRRYLPIALITLIYGWYFVQRGRAYAADQYAGPYAGLGLGPHILSNLRYYMTVIVFPWGGDMWESLFWWLIIVVFILAYSIFVRRNWSVAFVCTAGFLVVLPVLPLPFFGARYLYLPMMLSAILLALLFRLAGGTLARFKWSSVIVVVGVGLIAVGNSLSTADAAEGMTAFVRQYRLPVRPILQSHTAFPPDSYLYFLNSPIQTGIMSGIFSLRYGPNAIVNGADIPEQAGLRKHQSAYVYIYGDQGGPTEHVVNPTADTQIVPALPVCFSVRIRLEGYEEVSSHAKRGNDLVLLLYWEATAKIDASYTLFAHLVNSRGETVASADGMPQGGRMPTDVWRPSGLVVDWSVVPIGLEVPVGNYRLELGWYYAPTQERLSVIDSQGRTADKVIIAPFTVE